MHTPTQEKLKCEIGRLRPVGVASEGVASPGVASVGVASVGVASVGVASVGVTPVGVASAGVARPSLQGSGRAVGRGPGLDALGDRGERIRRDAVRQAGDDVLHLHAWGGPEAGNNTALLGGGGSFSADGMVDERAWGAGFLQPTTGGRGCFVL